MRPIPDAANIGGCTIDVDIECDRVTVDILGEGQLRMSPATSVKIGYEILRRAEALDPNVLEDYGILQPDCRIVPVSMQDPR